MDSEIGCGGLDNRSPPPMNFRKVLYIGISSTIAIELCTLQGSTMLSLTIIYIVVQSITVYSLGIRLVDVVHTSNRRRTTVSFS